MAHAVVRVNETNTMALGNHTIELEHQRVFVLQQLPQVFPQHGCLSKAVPWQWPRSSRYERPLLRLSPSSLC